MQTQPDQHFEVAIVGGGFGGLGLAIALMQDGIDDFVVSSAPTTSAAPGATTPIRAAPATSRAYLYSFSFEQNPEWSRLFARPPRSSTYIARRRARIGVDAAPALRHEVPSAAGTTRQRWGIETSARDHLTADVFVAARRRARGAADPGPRRARPLHRPVFHSRPLGPRARPERASTSPSSAPAPRRSSSSRDSARVGRLHLFQRTPPWIVPRDEPSDPRAAGGACSAAICG